VTREVEFLSNVYTNPKTLTTLALTLADHHDAFESPCAPVFCDFARNYSCTVDGAVVASLLLLLSDYASAINGLQLAYAGALFSTPHVGPIVPYTFQPQRRPEWH